MRVAERRTNRQGADHLPAASRRTGQSAGDHRERRSDPDRRQRGRHIERDQLSNTIIEYLEQNDGIGLLTDKSPPDAIYQAFGVSKANYKKALGKLYKERRITIEKHQITLL